jgi:Flp pilus assembly pilin Flp
MKTPTQLIRRAFRAGGKLLKNKAGQDLIEYALLAALVASLAIAIFPAIGSTDVLFSRAMSALSQALAATAGN